MIYHCIDDPDLACFDRDIPLHPATEDWSYYAPTAYVEDAPAVLIECPAGEHELRAASTACHPPQVLQEDCRGYRVKMLFVDHRHS